MRSEFRIELDREIDGRWIAEVTSLPGVMAYGKSKDEAMANVEALAFRVLADQMEDSHKPMKKATSFTCA